MSIVKPPEKSSEPFLSELHRAAVEYARDGYPVFPCIPNGKVPATGKGFHDATTDIDTINRWWRECPTFNIGIEPERLGLCVVEIEPDGLAQVAEFCDGHGPLPRTFTNRSPRGGEHRFFAGSLQSLVRPFKGFEIDTRGRGGYVLLPPSHTADGEYTTIDDGDVADLPEWITARLASRKYDRQASAEGLQDDLPDNVRRAERWLSDHKPPVSGERNYRTFIAACRIKDLGCSPDKTLELITAWAPIADDFTEDEVQIIVSSAFKNGQNMPGNDAVQPSSEAFKNLLANVMPAGPVLFSDLLKREVGPVQELIPGLIEKGVATMLAGPGGVHKSRTAVHWGLAVSEGVPVYGRQTERSRFVFVSYEDHPDEVARRAQAMTRRLKCDWGPNAEYWDKTRSTDALAVVSDTEGITLQPFYHRLRDHLRSIVGHKFVVLDSTYNVLVFIGQAKISEPAVKAAIELLNGLCRETDSTILFLWHPSQAGQERGDASGWSVAWHNAPRARVSLREAEKDAFELRVEKRNNAPKGPPLTLHWDSGLLLPRASKGTAGEAALIDACVSAALTAAEMGEPIVRRFKLPYWMIDQIEREVGFRATDKQVKDALQQAVMAKRLRYTNARGKIKAGYFPFDAEFLANGEVLFPRDPRPADERE